jgi:protein-disulfide isomerase
VSSTPTFFVNGRMMIGAKPFEEFQDAIEHELRRSS